MFVAVYQKALKLLYVEDLLKVVKRDFTPRFEQHGVHHTYDYDDVFRAHVKRLEHLAETQKAAPTTRAGQPTPQQRQGAVVASNGNHDDEDDDDDDDGEEGIQDKALAQQPASEASAAQPSSTDEVHISHNLTIV